VFRTRSSSLLLAAALLLTGCGLSGADKEAAQSLAASLRQEYTGISADQARCVAEHWVTEIGVPELKKAKLIGGNNTVTGDVRDVELSEAQAKEALAGFEHCTDFRMLAAGMVSSLLDADDEQAACIDKAVTDDVARSWAISDLQGKVTDNVYVVGGRGCMSTDEENRRAVDALASSFGRANGLGAQEGRCVAEGLVETIGTHELTAAGVLDDRQRLTGELQGTPLNATDAELAANVVAGCVTVEEMLTASMVGGGNKGSGPQVKACFADAFDDATFHAYLVDTLMGGQGNLDAQTTRQLADCLKQVVEKD